MKQSAIEWLALILVLIAVVVGIVRTFQHPEVFGL